MKIFIVIPVFNEENYIRSVIKKIKRQKLPVIVIDDGSTDLTLLKLRGVSKTVGCSIEVLSHNINLGKGAAMKTGAEAAFLQGADAVIFMDSDGQHDIGDLPKFVKKLNEGYEVVYGSRNMQMGVPLVRYLGNKTVSLLISFLFGIYVSDILCGYRATTNKAYDKIKWESAEYAVETEMVIRTAKNKLKYCEVPVATLYLDVFKGVSLMDAIGILFDILRWRIKI